MHSKLLPRFWAVRFAAASILFLSGSLLAAFSAVCPAADVTLAITSPMPPPEWALLERELLRANTAACEEFFARYFDERGYLLCVERWGGDDGPDDAIENCNDWPILHALGAPDVVRQMVRKAWEGHVRQFTLAKTTEVPFARDGMYYKEFPVMFDWQHNGEGLTVFNVLGLSEPDAPEFERRVRRFSGFYMAEEPGAENYDPQHRIIRSLFNGSRGPLLRKATALDWTGDPIEVANRFSLGHGERSYEEMLAHFQDYNDIVGDHPLNLIATSLATNAYLRTHEEKYRRWVIDYVDAWYDRMQANGNIIPSNIGLDGTIGGECGGRWYGGTYGWGFSVVVPQTGELADRNRHWMGFVGFMNAYLLTGDTRYLDAWRRQMDTINAQKRVIDGVTMYPHMHGDDGWYSYTPDRYNANALEIFYLSMEPADAERVGRSSWIDFVAGRNPDYPTRALQGDLSKVRERVEGMRADPTTPDTRLADDPMKFNPASIGSLIELMLGGIHPGHRSSLLHCRLRYFDPVARRPGMPEDVAALVERLTADEVQVVLVNVSQLHEREVVVQAGAYGEHQFGSVTAAGNTIPVDAPSFRVRLAPGSGERFTIRTQRYANRPTLALPWNHPANEEL